MCGWPGKDISEEIKIRDIIEEGRKFIDLSARRLCFLFVFLLFIWFPILLGLGLQT